MFCSCWERNTWSFSKTICFPLLKKFTLSCVLFHSIIINRAIHNLHFPLARSYEFYSVSLSNECISTTISSAPLLLHFLVSVLMMCFTCSITDSGKTKWLNIYVHTQRMSQEKEAFKIGGGSLNIWKYFIPCTLDHYFYLSTKWCSYNVWQNSHFTTTCFGKTTPWSRILCLFENIKSTD